MNIRTGITLAFAIAASQAFGQAEPASRLADAATSRAAADVATQFLRLIYDKPPSAFNVDAVKLGEDSATDRRWLDVDVSSDDKTCWLQLVRNAQANPKGWVVQLYSCGRHQDASR